jgi:hypothetical protein
MDRRGHRMTFCTAALAVALGSPRSAGAADAPAPSKPKPGYAVGHVLKEDGKPITVPGAKITVAFHGISSKSGERVEYAPKVKPDGSYEQKLVDGTYHVFAAQLQVPFQGKTFLLALEPLGDDKSDQDSEKGIAQDYVWKVKGLRPGKEADEGNFTNWYGASVGMKLDTYRNDVKKSVPRPPQGTKYVFTLTPQGKLIDGSDGQVLTFTRGIDRVLGGLEKNGSLNDVPIGVYIVKGEEVAPDGAKKPLLIMQQYPKYGDSAEARFEPGSSTGAWPRNVNFTRPGN